MMIESLFRYLDNFCWAINYPQFIILTAHHRRLPFFVLEMATVWHKSSPKQFGLVRFWFEQLFTWLVSVPIEAAQIDLKLKINNFLMPTSLHQYFAEWPVSKCISIFKAVRIDFKQVQNDLTKKLSRVKMINK